MEVGQRIHPGAHAQSQPTAFKAQRNEPEPAAILLRQMAAGVVLETTWRHKAATLSLIGDKFSLCPPPAAA